MAENEPMETWQTIAWSGALHCQAAMLLFDSRKKLTRPDGSASNLPAAANSVAIVNLALSVELLLKALARKTSDETPWGHDLPSLWAAIDRQIQSKVEHLCATPVEQICQEQNKTFEKWRYHWEDPCLVGDPTTLLVLATALREVADVGVMPVNKVLNSARSPLGVDFLPPKP